MSNSWIPVSSGKYPPVGMNVQVTYLGHYDKKAHCDQFAHINSYNMFNEPIWKWSFDTSDVYDEIIAWRYNDDAYDPGKKTAPNKYNSAVRRCMSDECVRVGEELQMVKLKHSEVCEQLHDKSISHSDYVDKEKYLRVLDDKIRRLEVELNTWDGAREICLNVADGVGDN